VGRVIGYLGLVVFAALVPLLLVTDATHIFLLLPRSLDYLLLHPGWVLVGLIGFVLAEGMFWLVFITADDKRSKPPRQIHQRLGEKVAFAAALLTLTILILAVFVVESGVAARDPATRIYYVIIGLLVGLCLSILGLAGLSRQGALRLFHRAPTLRRVCGSAFMLAGLALSLTSLYHLVS